MDIKEIKKEKKILESRISEIIKEFSIKTECIITSISLHYSIEELDYAETKVEIE